LAFSFSPETGRYRDVATGRLIREEPIRRALDQVINAQAATVRQLTQSLIDGQIGLDVWQAQMMSSIKSVHIVGATLANGGWSQMDQSDWGWTGSARIRPQYAYLRDFAAQLANGKQPLNGSALARAELYAQAGRATHRAAQERLAKQRGMEREKSNLGAADHCSSCLTEAARGWQPVGSLIPVGARTCLSRCHCWFTYQMTPAA
jgi:hypothetical protein